MERLLGRHRGTIVLATAVMTFLLFAAGLVGVATIEEESTAQAPFDPGKVVQEDPTPAQPPIDLTPLISPAPAGFDRTTPAVDGAATKEQLAENRGSTAGAMTLFDQLDLQNGFVRTWVRTGGDDLLALRLYQFSKASGAAKYAELGVAAREVGAAKRFDVPGVSGAVGVDVGITADSEGRHLAFVFVPKGRIVAVVAASLREPPDLAVVTALARSQVALLP